jgi:hypothetical protein
VRRNPRWTYTIAEGRVNKDSNAYEYKSFQSFAAKAWPAIDRAVTALIGDTTQDDIAPNRASALDGISPDLYTDQLLGYGYWGAVFPTNFERWVVKLTTDPIEGPVSQFVIDTPKLRDNAGVARFLYVWQHPRPVKLGKEGSFKVYVLVREAIEPVALSEIPHATVRAVNDMLNEASNLMRMLRSHARDPHAVSADTVDPWYVRWANEVALLSTHAEFRNVARFIQLAYSEGGIILHDAHIQNTGWRAHDYSDFSQRQYPMAPPALVIHDLGHSSFGENMTRSEIAKLPMMVRNPPIPMLEV